MWSAKKSCSGGYEPDVQVDAEAALTEAAYKLRQTTRVTQRKHLDTSRHCPNGDIASSHRSPPKTSTQTEVEHSGVAKQSEAVIEEAATGVSRDALPGRPCLNGFGVCRYQARTHKASTSVLHPASGRNGIRRLRSTGSSHLQQTADSSPSLLERSGSFGCKICNRAFFVRYQALEPRLEANAGPRIEHSSCSARTTRRDVCFKKLNPLDGGTVGTVCEFRGPDFYQGTVSNDGSTVVFASGG